MKFANNGKVTVCGQWTSEMKTHFLISIAHCSDKDKFNKAEGKQIAKTRMNYGVSIVLQAKYTFLGAPVNLKLQLKDFLLTNC
jgi:Cys-tRNA synthase (O-phospho-L-seryl-tRNA:Cys-tRNA synthase)